MNGYEDNTIFVYWHGKSYSRNKYLPVCHSLLCEKYNELGEMEDRLAPAGGYIKLRSKKSSVNCPDCQHVLRWEKIPESLLAHYHPGLCPKYWGYRPVDLDFVESKAMQYDVETLAEVTEKLKNRRELRVYKEVATIIKELSKASRTEGHLKKCVTDMIHELTMARDLINDIVLSTTGIDEKLLQKAQVLTGVKSPGTKGEAPNENF